MTRKNLIIIFLVLFAILIAYNNFYTSEMISGKYIYKFPYFTAEGPKQGDAITLKENGSFESDTWGKGTYKLSGSTLNLNYTYEFGKAEFETNIYRPLFVGNPRIRISEDLNYYFEKEK